MRSEFGRPGRLQPTFEPVDQIKPLPTLPFAGSGRESPYGAVIAPIAVNNKMWHIMRKYDLLLTPTLAVPPFEAGIQGAADDRWGQRSIV